MDTSTLLSRAQFAFTIGYHYLFPQLTMGLALLILILKTLYLKRLESSLDAFEISIRRQQVFQERFYDLLVNEERLLDSATNRRLLALESG